MSISETFNYFKTDLLSVKDLEVMDLKSEREKYSRDFYDYSPILKEKLSGCIADLVVKPITIEAVLQVAKICRRYSYPLTLRGSGTGNYGQCVPLFGGVVMLMSEFKNIREVNKENGVVTVESGCLLRDLDNKIALSGRELRLLPSTWRSASIGGFIAGGSGGIGSVKWGFLRDPGHLLGLEIVTLEESPRILSLDSSDSEALNHSYGTNGIITALKISTAPLTTWQEITLDCESFSKALGLLRTFSKAAVDLHLCTLLEKDIVNHLPAWSGPANGLHRLLILVSPDGVSTLQKLAKSVGEKISVLGSENRYKGSGLRELTWNHTTLHMRKIDPQWTYLQMLLPEPEMPFLKKLKDKWGADLIWHLEAVRQQGAQRIAALPLVKWRDTNSLEELIDDCRKTGAIIFNPHVITVEDGGLGVVDSDQVKAKRKYDSCGLLNPGKLKGWGK